MCDLAVALVIGDVNLRSNARFGPARPVAALLEALRQCHGAEGMAAWRPRPV